MTNLETDAIEPDDKDWTWTLERACPECGFEAAAVVAAEIAELVTRYTEFWPEILARVDARYRPTPRTWSALEYGCHVRDVCHTMTGRANLLLQEDNPTFANWDQDETAMAKAYAAQSPSVVADEILAGRPSCGRHTPV